MADPLGSLEKIVKLAFRIKEAVDTVRQNKEECQQIRTRAVRVSSLLSRLPETGITGDPAMCDVLDDLEEALRHAHLLVTACQQSGTVCLYCTAGRQARRLRKVQDDISQKVMLVVFATNIHTTIILTNCIRAAPPPESLVMGVARTPDVVVPCNNSAGDASGSSEEDVVVNNGFVRPRHRATAADIQAASSTFKWRTSGSSEEGVVVNNGVVWACHCATAADIQAASSTFKWRRALRRARGANATKVPLASLTPSAGIQEIAAHAVSHSLFNSGTEYSYSGHQAVSPLTDSTSPPVMDQAQDPLSVPPAATGSCLRKFSSSELEAATHHFSMENMVGSGAFATVYKGELHDGLVVAVKKFLHPYVLSSANLDKLHLISNLKHKNIVKLIGYSGEVLWIDKLFQNAKTEGKEDNETSYLLVEEYMPNGSLEKTTNGLQLDWSSHFHIIQGIAHGLCYLQEKGVVHMDVKPSNILLDSDMNPKITDFGIARMLNHTGGDICSDIAIAGTLGYMPPEYITNGTLSKKHDVYGFGVTLLETTSSLSRSGRASGQASIKWAWEARQAGGIMEQLDAARFDASSQLKEIERCIEVGLLCTQFELEDRPDMLDALKMLCGEKSLRTPVRPGYTNKEPVSWLRRWLRR